MSKSNKKAKEELIRLYGAECFIDKLHLRIDEKPRVYKGKVQYYKMKQLTYHHILERSKGGKATIENGAILSVENHEWFNKQPAAEQRRMNDAFQEYKRTFKIAVAEITPEEIKQVKVYEEDLEEYETIPVYDMTEEEITKYEEHKRERNKRIIQKMKGEER